MYAKPPKKLLIMNILDTLKENAYTHSDVIESKFEVTSISGTITPA